MQKIQNEKVVAQPQKKAYTAPKLARHGKVEELTQGLGHYDCSGPIEYQLPSA